MVELKNKEIAALTASSSTSSTDKSKELATLNALKQKEIAAAVEAKVCIRGRLRI